MGGKRRSILDFTPLLDVVLLLLFAFMLMMTAQGEKQQQAVEAYKEQTQEAVDQSSDAKEQVTKLTAEQVALQESIDALNEEKAELESKLDNLTKENEALNCANDQERESLDQVIGGLAQFLGTNEQQIKSLLEDGDQSALEELTDTKEAAAMLHRYKALSQQFYFIDVMLATEGNRLYINNEATTLGIGYDEINEHSARVQKIDAIKDEIEAVIRSRQGGSAMIFITLSVKDADVYQYAWDAVWDAIGELQEKYGTEKLFRTYIRWTVD